MTVARDAQSLHGALCALALLARPALLARLVALDAVVADDSPARDRGGPSAAALPAHGRRACSWRLMRLVLDRWARRAALAGRRRRDRRESDARPPRRLRLRWLGVRVHRSFTWAYHGARLALQRRALSEAVQARRGGGGEVGGECPCSSASGSLRGVVRGSTASRQPVRASLRQVRASSTSESRRGADVVVDPSVQCR